MKTKIANTVYTQKELQRIGPAAAYIVRYFVRRKFTIAEMRKHSTWQGNGLRKRKRR